MRPVTAIKLRWQTVSLRGANSAGTYIADGMERQGGATLETREWSSSVGHLMRTSFDLKVSGKKKSRGTGTGIYTSETSSMSVHIFVECVEDTS